MAKPVPRLSPEDIQRVVAAAWVDPPPYDRIRLDYGVGPGALQQLMRRELTPSAFKLWQARDKKTKRPTVRSTFPFGR
ncbi:uncharacterized protein (TIGR03643 family) [Inhella inkyongensis]|uniref:Uncharacterized protein (TIGR03643 family) n=1 Tax=Inhella inkyongensis TaxID=392593 RepID=A0A840SB20_9BURK|nr:DUF2805 domain-containing protein [Inhella inkyongensis]MBB5205984.1 uncharacterized protein (TIGR03643 family) [Inhella inkyongensis]